MLVLAILFVIAAAITFAAVLLGSTDALVMPWSCPGCHAGSDRTRTWFITHNRTYQCRNCRKQYREAANGMLVEIR